MNDPVQRLAERIAPTCPAVDALQVAAVLESDGLTDRAAREEYGYRDVFALAEEIFSRLPGPAAAAEHPRRRRPARTARELSHGLLYVLPSAAFPAAYALLGLRGLVAGMVLATALGWVWSMGNTVLAYRLLGTGHYAPAAAALRRGILLGLVVGGVAGLALSQLLALPAGVVVLVLGQLGFQLAAGTLLFFRLERLLLLTMVPTVVVGIGYITTGRPGAPWVVGTGIASVAVAATAAYLVALRPGDRLLTALTAPTPPPNVPAPALRRELAAVAPIVGYAALCAAYLLFADARYVDAGMELSLAVTPLVLGMGALEWQARRFSENAVALTRRCRYPAEFVARIWRLFGAGIGTVVGIVGLLAAALAVLFAQLGVLTPRSVVVIAAHVMLGGAYFIGFILINHGRLRALLAVTSAVLAGHVLASLAPLPYSHGAIFLASSTTLLALLLVTVCTSLAEVRRYRW